MRIVGFGTYDREKHPRVGILLDGLRQIGEEVTELNAPLGFTTAERVAMLGKPWLAYRLLLRLLRRWWALTVRRATARPTPDVVLVGYLGHFDVILARLLFPRTVIALDLLIFASETASDRFIFSLASVEQHQFARSRTWWWLRSGLCSVGGKSGRVDAGLKTG